MNRNTRITLEDTGITSITKIAEGNPGALRVCMELLLNGSAIDPDSVMGGLGNLLSLDTHGIYGSEVWMLYKDVCGEDLTDTIGILRACQLGILPEQEMLQAIRGAAPLSTERFNDLIAAVRERLPAFGQV